MKALAFLALAVAASALCGCETVAKNLPVTIDALDKAYGHCQRDVTFHASAGALNPSSGVEVSGKYSCAPKASAPEPAAPAAPSSGG